MGRFGRKGKVPSFSHDKAQDPHRQRCGRYWLAGKRAFQKPEAGPFFSIVQDATRVGGLDMLYSALWSSSLSLAMWLPPMAGAS
eukprot:2539531-Lingulodinium_polyedra.AAC.1